MLTDSDIERLRARRSLERLARKLRNRSRYRRHMSRIYPNWGRGKHGCA